MKEIFMEHIRRYPKMQVTDAVKLLYQSEFGGGHMIANPVRSLNWIKEEWKQMQVKSESGAATAGMAEEKARSVCEEIGGGLCRISLQALGEGLAPETLNGMFVKTADRAVGSVEGFERKLEMLNQCCKEGLTPFGMEELEQYLKDYRAKGYPPVSHSEQYRVAYGPSYRVVSMSFARYYQVFLKIDRAMAEEERSAVTNADSKCVDATRQKQVVVAIDGMCGSGKSTLGRILQEIYDCNLFHMDDFFLRPEQRTPERLAEPGGNVDYERFKEEILNCMADREGFSYQIYNCGKQVLDGVVKVPFKKLNIIEGAYSHHPYFGEPYHLKFFCKISREEQVSRIMKRNGPEMLERFKQIWIPMENRYFETFGIEEKSMVI